MSEFTQQYINELKSALNAFPHGVFEAFIEAALDAYEREKHIFVMGNGGSAATASHWACDINKGCSLGKEKKFRMICLNDSISMMMAYANDLSYGDVFVEQMRNFFEPGDLVIGISGSGNSENVLRAIGYARDHGGRTVGLSGFDGGKLKGMVDIPLHADVDDMQKVEDVHVIFAHMSMQRILKALG